MDPSPALPGPLAAVGQPGSLSVFWTGRGAVFRRGWGEHNGWVPQDVALDADVMPGTPIYAMAMASAYTGVWWASEEKVYTVYEDATAPGEWRRGVLDAPGVRPGTPLAAAGRPGYLSVWWAGEGMVMRKHWGHHNDWEPQDDWVPTPVPVAPGTRLYGFSRAGEHDGVVWAGDGEVHHLYHDSLAWDAFKHEVFPQAGVSPDTPLAACGRTGWLGVFWAQEERVHMLEWGVHNGWVPTHVPLAPDVRILPGMPLHAMCRDGEYSGVVWTGFGQTHHLYQDHLAWGLWKYEHLSVLDPGEPSPPALHPSAYTSAPGEGPVELVQLAGRWAPPTLASAVVLAAGLWRRSRRRSTPQGAGSKRKSE